MQPLAASSIVLDCSTSLRIIEENKFLIPSILYNNLFFNTNITNFSNVAERLTEGTIRFVLHTNLFELHECR